MWTLVGVDLLRVFYKLLCLWVFPEIGEKNSLAKIVQDL